MKLAFVPSTFLPWVGGAEIQAHNTANKMIEIGNDVDIFLLDKVKINNKKYKIVILNKILINFVFLLKYYLNINFSFLLKFYFKEICKNKRYDVWHFHSVNYKTLIYIEVLKSLKQKVFITFQGADIQKDYEIKYGYRFDTKYENFLKKIILLVDGVFAISKNIQKDLNFFSYPSKKIFLIPNSIEIKKIKEVKKNSINNQKLKIITVARFYEKKKGLDIIEKIAKIFIDNNFDFEWTLVGRNSNFLLKTEFISKNRTFFKMEKEINNFDEVYFPHNDLIKIYKKQDIYVNLARVESFGITIIEALAAELPVISFNTKGANEIVINNQNGFLIEKYDPVEMANFLMKNFDKLSNNKNLNFDTILHYDLEINTRLTAEVYKR